MRVACVDVDECDLSLEANRRQSRCSRFAKCTNTIGSYDCQCRPGFRGDGKTCHGPSVCYIAFRALVCVCVCVCVFWLCKAQIPLGSSRLASTRLDTFDFVEPCFSNMADDEEAVVLACTSLVFCALSVHVNKTEKRRHAVRVKDYLKKETFGCYNSLLMSDLMNHKAIWSNINYP